MRTATGRSWAPPRGWMKEDKASWEASFNGSAAVSRPEICHHAGLCPAETCCRNRIGQQKVHEYEALRGNYGRRLYCRLTSFGRSLQTNLRITLDTLYLCEKFFFMCPYSYQLVAESGHCHLLIHMHIISFLTLLLIFSRGVTLNCLNLFQDRSCDAAAELCFFI